MRRIITLVALAAVIVIAGFLYLFKREAVGNMYDSVRGYPEAKTPQESVDLFKKAVADRKYDKAAKYCTKDYAEQLRKGAEPARLIGNALDDLKHRMTNDGVLTSEIEYILHINDPLPPELKLTLQTPGDKEAFAAISVDNPALQSLPTKTWKYDAGFIKAFYADYPVGYVKLIKEGDVWKLDVPVSPAMRTRVDRLVAVHMDYVNALKKMSEEVRTERTTKFEVANRLEELLTEAVGAAR